MKTNLDDYIAQIWECDRKIALAADRGDSRSVKNIKKDRFAEIKAIQELLKNDPSARSDFFTLDTYVIRRLVFEGLMLQRVQLAANEEFYYRGKDISSNLDERLNGVRECLLAAIEGEKDHNDQLLGRKIHVVRHGFTKGYILADVIERITRTFSQVGKRIANFWNQSLFISKSQLTAAEKTLEAFQKEFRLPRVPRSRSEVDEARYLLVNLREVLNDPYAKDEASALFLDPETGHFVWRKGSFEDSLANQETAQTIIQAVLTLRNANHHVLSYPDDEMGHLVEILDKLEETPWGKGFADHVNTNYSQKFEQLKDRVQLSEKQFDIVQKRTVREKINAICIEMVNPNCRLSVKRSLLNWLTDYLQDPPSSQDLKGMEEEVARVIAVSKNVKGLDKENFALRVVVDKDLPDDQMELFKLKRRVEAFNEKWKVIPKSQKIRRAYKQEIHELMDDYVIQADHFRGKSMDDRALRAIFEVPALFKESYDKYLEFKGKNSSKKLEAPFREVLARLVGFQSKVRVRRISEAPPIVELDAEKNPKLAKSYEELLHETQLFSQKLKAQEKILQALLIACNEPKDRILVLQALEDLKPLMGSVRRVLEATTFNGPLPTSEELQNLEVVFGTMHESLLHLARLVVFAGPIPELDKKMANESPAYREVRDQNMEKANLKGQSAQGLFMATAQRVMQYPLMLKECAKFELSEERKEIIRRVDQTFENEVSFPINEIISDPMKLAMDKLSAEELEANFEVVALREDLERIWHVVKGLKHKEKLRLGKGGLEVLERKGTGKPGRSKEAFKYVIEQVSRGVDLGILELQGEDGKVGLNKFLNQLKANEWVGDILKTDKDIYSQFLDCNRKVNTAIEEAIKGERFELAKVHNIYLPKKFLKRIEETVQRKTEQLNQVKAELEKVIQHHREVVSKLNEYGHAEEFDFGSEYGSLITLDIYNENVQLEKEIDLMRKDVRKLENEIRTLENLPRNRQIIQKMHHFEYGGFLGDKEIQNCIDPYDFTYSYKSIMSTKEMLDHVVEALKSEDLPKSQKVVILNFIHSWIESGLYQEEFHNNVPAFQSILEIGKSLDREIIVEIASAVNSSVRKQFSKARVSVGSEEASAFLEKALADPVKGAAQVASELLSVQIEELKQLELNDFVSSENERLKAYDSSQDRLCNYFMKFIVHQQMDKKNKAKIRQDILNFLAEIGKNALVNRDGQTVSLILRIFQSHLLIDSKIRPKGVESLMSFEENQDEYIRGWIEEGDLFTAPLSSLSQAFIEARKVMGSEHSKHAKMAHTLSRLMLPVVHAKESTRVVRTNLRNVA